MLELTPENAGDYLLARGWVGPGPVQVEPLSGGVSAVVLRVTTPERKFVLKQSRPQLLTKAAWFSDRDRIWREMEVMQTLRPLLPPPIVPEVLFHDPEHYVFGMSHATEPFRVWKESLLASEVKAHAAQHVGQVLGQMHQNTTGQPRLREQFAELRIFEQLRIEPFYRTVQRRCPDVAPLIEPIIERLYYVKDGICHGDYTPKNILIHAQGFTLVDYETAYYGDPSMDVGLLLAHLLLKAFRTFGAWNPHISGVDVLDWYYGVVTYRPRAQLESWGIEHCAVCLLARIDGTSPIDYLDEPRRDAVRQLARQLLHDQPAQWLDAFEIVALSLADLHRQQVTP